MNDATSQSEFEANTCNWRVALENACGENTINKTILIDHSILVNKLRNLTVPSSIIDWIIDFLSNRSRRIKLAKGCYSEWGPVPSGVPQGTKLGPWLFVLMINDLDVNTPHLYLWKFFDDTTASEVVPKGNTSNA